MLHTSLKIIFESTVKEAARRDCFIGFVVISSSRSSELEVGTTFAKR